MHYCKSNEKQDIFPLEKYIHSETLNILPNSNKLHFNSTSIHKLIHTREREKDTHRHVFPVSVGLTRPKICYIFFPIIFSPFPCLTLRGFLQAQEQHEKQSGHMSGKLTEILSSTLKIPIRDLEPYLGSEGLAMVRFILPIRCCSLNDSKRFVGA